MAKSGDGVEIVCELFFFPERSVNACQTQVFERALSEAMAKTFPDVRIKGLYVHQRIRPSPEEDES